MATNATQAAATATAAATSAEMVTDDEELAEEEGEEGGEVDEAARLGREILAIQARLARITATKKHEQQAAIQANKTEAGEAEADGGACSAATTACIMSLAALDAQYMPHAGNGCTAAKDDTLTTKGGGVEEEEEEEEEEDGDEEAW